jgi:hypothetical protein
VVFDILIEHFSYGNTNNVFWKNTSLLFNKWKRVLPIVRSVEMSDKFIDYVNESTERYIKLHNTIYEITNSKTYRLGNTLLQPLRAMRKLLKK